MRLIIFLLTFSTFAQVSYNPDIELYKLSQISKPQKILEGLKDLKLKNKARKKKLVKAKTYNGNEFNYILTLDKLLSLLPNNVKEIPDCSNLYNQILNGDKRPWGEQDQPTHQVWAVFEKLCSK